MVLQLSGRLRRRLALSLLTAVTVWPLLQHGLARSLELDPWAFFGFAMYSVPNLRLNVRAGALDGSGREPDWSAVPFSSYALLREYAERRARYGRLLSPDHLARRLLDANPEIPQLLIRIRRWRISPETSRLEPVDTDYVYPDGAARSSVSR